MNKAFRCTSRYKLIVAGGDSRCLCNCNGAPNFGLCFANNDFEELGGLYIYIYILIKKKNSSILWLVGIVSPHDVGYPKGIIQCKPFSLISIYGNCTFLQWNIWCKSVGQLLAPIPMVLPQAAASWMHRPHCSGTALWTHAGCTTNKSSWYY